jgi:hypothetical protein
MTSSHVIDYFVITAADITAIFLAWLAGKGWIEKKAQQISKVNWQQSGSLYWLSSDLVWTEMQVMAGRVPRMIHGLKKAIHHATSLGVGDPLLSRLKTLEIANVTKQNLTEADKTALIGELDDIIGQIGKLAEQHQGDFKAGPEP